MLREKLRNTVHSISNTAGKKNTVHLVNMDNSNRINDTTDKNLFKESVPYRPYMKRRNHCMIISFLLSQP